MKEKICQSCAMPMVKVEDFGTELDGSTSKDYCRYCFKEGCFTENLTLQEMIQKLVNMHDKMGLSKEDGEEMAETILPTLKRWKKRKSCCGCCHK